MGKIVLKGGKKLAEKLAEMSEKVSRAHTVKAGFLEGTTYDDGTPIAYVAAIQEFGATINVEEHQTTIYREVNKAGTAFNKDGRFVRKDKANFASDHTVKGHTITIPARPFFRGMIAKEKGHWGSDLAEALVDAKFSAHDALVVLGAEIADALKHSIRDFTNPPNAKSTIAKKGFNDPLIDDGTMQRAASSEVE